MDIKKEILAIKRRNKRVEADKAWETSWSRVVLIFVLTYLVILLFMLLSKIDQPFINAAFSATAFTLSTLILGPVKRWWIEKYLK
jgi:polyferredoxin